MHKIKVLTWNIRHALTDEGTVDIKAFIEELLHHEVDVILLQEVDRFANRSGNVDQFSEIKKALGRDWQGFWTTRKKLGKTGLYGLATFIKRPIYASNNHILSDLHKEKCYAQECQIDIDGRPLSIVNLHMPYDGHTGVVHAKTAWQTLIEIKLEHDIIIGGDFNAYQNSAEMQMVLSECADVGENTTSTSGKIDYCLGRGRAVPIDQRVIYINLSDHYPFITTFLLKPFEHKI
jgi:endonuclease/exonuclease/phosphatase family metal-dependent hydrolase